MTPRKFRDDISNGSGVIDRQTERQTSVKVTDTAENNITLAMPRCAGGSKCN